MKQYKVTFRNQLKALEFAIVIVLFTIGCMLYFFYSYPFFKSHIFTWLLLAQVLPVLYLHIEYLTYNSGDSLFINYDLSIFKFKKGTGEEFNLNFNQISKMTLYLPPSSYRGSIARKMQFLPVEPYGYAEIYSQHGDRVIITTLMLPDLLVEMERIKGITFEKKKRLFASPSFEQVIRWFLKD